MVEISRLRCIKVVRHDHPLNHKCGSLAYYLPDLPVASAADDATDIAVRIVIGICTCNRPQLLARLLRRLEKISLDDIDPSTVLIVVADNMPDKSVQAICDDARAYLPLRLVYLEEHQRGISHARNRIVDKTLALGADCLAFIDDDDLPDPDWLVRLIERQNETSAEIVMGNRIYVLPETAEPSVRERLKQPRMFNDTKIWKENGLPHQLSTCNVLIRRETLARLAESGPVFDPVFALMGGGDADFFCRAHRSGSSFARAEHSFIQFRVWPHRATLRGILRRKFKGGFSQGLLVRRYLSNRHRIRWIGEVFWRLIRSILVLPVECLTKTKASRAVSKIGWAIGALYGFAGGQYDYYRN